ncbi:MAG: 4-(cytidine 5'-diphospho)-2-C-methyl-D-erythritol kinase [Chlamydiia bacterium]|nr:4-(cytidine 5'-diphospho)-2-C-methyl-D-erythritol kinase [Chlamydiia bacterium]
MLTLNSPAKVNLFLKVLNKREDGYHDIASLFQTIDLFDEIRLKLSDQDEFTCSDPELQNKENLVVKAIRLFREKSGKDFFVSCHLVKHIPKEAGLGGGSSNAATCLNGLNQLLNFPLENDELLDIARELGSDVPFFLYGGSAYCEGRGDKIKRIKPLEPKRLWVIKPPEGIPTPEVYKCLDLNQLPSKNPLQTLQDHLLGKGEYYNDLEAAALSISPAVKELKEILKAQGFEKVMLSGSGSTLIAFDELTPELPPEYFVRKCRFT